MTSDTILEVPLELIDDSDRLREVDPAWAEALAGHIREFGLQTPVEIREAGPDGRHKLVFGAHRVAAFRSLLIDNIPAKIFRGNDLQARLAEIDENLVRRELGPLERAIFLAERKRVYLALNPAATRGKVGKNKEFRIREIISFASSVAKKIGLSERAVNLDIAIAEALAPDVRHTLQEERLGLKQTELRRLAEWAPERQRAVVAAMVDRGASFGAAVEFVGARPAPKVADEEAQYRALMAAWAKNPSVAARKRFLAAVSPKKKETVA